MEGKEGHSVSQQAFTEYLLFTQLVLGALEVEESEELGLHPSEFTVGLEERRRGSFPLHRTAREVGRKEI